MQSAAATVAAKAPKENIQNSRLSEVGGLWDRVKRHKLKLGLGSLALAFAQVAAPPAAKAQTLSFVYNGPAFNVPQCDTLTGITCSAGNITGALLTYGYSNTYSGSISIGSATSLTLNALGVSFNTSNCPFGYVYLSNGQISSTNLEITRDCTTPNADFIQNYSGAQDYAELHDGSGNVTSAGYVNSASFVGAYWTNTKSLGAPCDLSGAPFCGDPVNIATGNVYEEITDYSTAGQNPLAFTRYYNSQASTETFALEMGTHWRNNFDRYIQIQSSTSVLVERPDGQQLSFWQSGGAWVTDSDVDYTLTNSGSTWTLTDPDDTVETYTTSGSEAVLQTIKNRDSYTQTMHYTSGALTSVTDSYSRTLTLSYTSGLLTGLTTPESLALTYGYSTVAGSSLLTSVGYNTSPATSIAYLYENTSFPFALTGITDENAARYATWAYDGFARATSSQHGTGSTISGLTTISYDDSTGNRTVTGPLGVQDTYKFTALQGVSKLSEIDRAADAPLAAATETFAYDSNGYLNSKQDWNGNTTTYTNNSHGLPTQIVEASGSSVARTTNITYDTTWTRLPHVITTPGLTSTLNYDGTIGTLLTKVDADTTTTSIPYSTNGQSRTTTNTYTATGQLHTVQLPRTDLTAKTTYAYTSGTLTSITDALSHVTTINTYTGGGRPTKITDPNSVVTNLTYDTRNHLKTSAVTTAGGTRTTTYGYDAAENLTSVALPGGATLTNSYDNAHRLTTVTDLLSQTTNYTLDAMGNITLTALKTSGGTTKKSHSSSFDPAGHLITDTGGASQLTQYGNDSNGNPTSITDPLSDPATAQVFDALNRLSTITDRKGGVTTLTYDAHDRPLSVATPNGATTSYVYDGFGDVIQEASPDRGTIVYHYNGDKDLTQKVDALSITANYTYDALDRRLTAAYPAHTAENVAFTYDQTGHGKGVGHLTSMTDQAGSFGRSYDERGNITAEDHTHSTYTLTNSYGYDAAGLITSLTYPDGMILTYARDTMERITGITLKPTSSGASQTVVSSVTYNPFGPVTGLTDGNSIVNTRTYDGDYRMTNIKDIGTATIQNLTYTPNANDNITAVTDAVTSANNQTLGYDALDRLTSASGSYGSLTFGYDANGNRTNNSGTTWTYTANSNRLTAMANTVTTNANGSITGVATTPAALGYTYFNNGRLNAVTAGGTTILNYLYDGFGQKVTGTDSAQRFYQYDQAGDMIEMTDSTNSTKLDYIFLNGWPVATFVPGGTTGTLSFLHTDRLGAPRRATNASQTVGWTGEYQPFGGGTFSASTIANNLRLPGMQFEQATVQDYNMNRDYLPGAGRYLESDPIGLTGGFNTYAYALNNPGKNVDPMGQQVAQAVGAVIAGVTVYECYQAAKDFNNSTNAQIQSDQSYANQIQQCSSGDATSCNANQLQQSQQNMVSKAGQSVISGQNLVNNANGLKYPK